MITNNLKKYFKDKKSFTRNELFEFYLNNEKKLNGNTFAWRIYSLKKKGIIKEIGRGLYSFLDKKNYVLKLNKSSKKIINAVSRNFTDITFCISESSWINEFTTHQYSNNFIILEIEKDFIESVFYNLKEKFKTVFLKPNEIELERYISGLDEAIILVPLLTRAPIQKSGDKKYYIPTLEKLLVDIYGKSSPYFFLTDSEIATIIKSAFRKYGINQTTLLAYAERRGKKSKIKSYLIEKNLLESAND